MLVLIQIQNIQKPRYGHMRLSSFDFFEMKWNLFYYVLRMPIMLSPCLSSKFLLKNLNHVLSKNYSNFPSSSTAIATKLRTSIPNQLSDDVNQYQYTLCKLVLDSAPPEHILAAFIVLPSAFVARYHSSDIGQLGQRSKWAQDAHQRDNRVKLELWPPTPHPRAAAGHRNGSWREFLSHNIVYNHFTTRPVAKPTVS